MGSSTSPVPQWEHEDPQPPNRDTGTLISVLGPPEPPQPYSGDPVVWGHDPLLISLPTGRGGASIYGKHFEDELHSELKFTGEISVPKPHLYVSKRKKKKTLKKHRSHPYLHPFLPPSIPRCWHPGHGQRRAGHQRQPILHHVGAGAVVGWQTHHLWASVPRHRGAGQGGHGGNQRAGPAAG